MSEGVVNFLDLNNKTTDAFKITSCGSVEVAQILGEPLKSLFQMFDLFCVLIWCILIHVNGG
jgi:hypothetical protein